MNAQTTIIAAKASTALVTLTGRGKAERTMAFLNIAPLSFTETLSRDASIANIKKALGNAPTADHLRVAAVEYVIGRVAARLPAGEFPKASMAGGDKLEYARDIVTSYAAPPKDGVKAPKLHKSHKGRRTVTQHKVVRAAETAWLLIKAELGLPDAVTGGTGQTQKAKNEKAADKRAPHKNNAKAPTHSQLVAADKPVDADAAMQYLLTQSAMLDAYAKKHGKLVTGMAGTAVATFRTAMLKAGNTYQEVKARKIADAAAKAKA